MMTSNRPLEDWAKLIGDVPAATAILDRFLQHAQIIQITGKSYRLRQGSKSDSNSDTKEPALSLSKGRRGTAGGEIVSPPEDTADVTPASSDGGLAKEPHVTAAAR